MNPFIAIRRICNGMTFVELRPLLNIKNPEQWNLAIGGALQVAEANHNDLAKVRTELQKLSSFVELVRTWPNG